MAQLPAKLYKYVHPSLTTIFKNNCIRFTQPAYLNDPFELRLVLDKGLSDEDIDEFLNPEQYRTEWSQQRIKEAILNEVSKNLGSNASKLEKNPTAKNLVDDLAGKLAINLIGQPLESFLPSQRSMLENTSTALPLILRKQLHLKTGVLSLTEENDNLLMWAHYADSHRGFVLEFDPEHTFFDLVGKSGETALRPVEYGPRPRLKSLFDERIKGDFLQLFCIKSDYWAYEKEWRVIRPLENSDCPDENREQGIHLFRFPPDCITGIVLGMNTAADKKVELLRLVHEDARYQHTRIYGSWPSATEDRVVVTPIISDETHRSWKREDKTVAQAKDFAGVWAGSIALGQLINPSEADASQLVSRIIVVMEVETPSLSVKVTALDGPERGRTLSYTASVVGNELRVTGVDGSALQLMKVRRTADGLLGIVAALDVDDGLTVGGNLNLRGRD